MTDTYVAWNGREYPWPPPAGWEQRSDGRYWPVQAEHTVPQTGGFSPQYGPARVDVFALAESLPPPTRADRVGPRPLRRRSYVSLGIGVVCTLLLVQFVRLDVLGFTVTQGDFVGFDDPPAEIEIIEAPFGEERELSEQTKSQLLRVLECSNDDGASLIGEVINPIDGERAYLINVQFFVNGERLRDGFAEVVVPANGANDFTARSASPAVDGNVVCSFGSVFRFIPN